MSYTNSTIITPSHERGKHLNFEDRCSIRVCQKLGMSLRETAAIVCCAASTVLNELRRGTKERKCNRGRKPEYSAKYGQKVYEEHRSKCHRKCKVDAENLFYQMMTMFDISVDQFFFPEKYPENSCRKRIDVMLNSLDEKDLRVIEATIKALKDAKEAEEV